MSPGGKKFSLVNGLNPDQQRICPATLSPIGKGGLVCVANASPIGRHCQRAVQYCWAQPVRNIPDKVRGADQPAIKAGLHAIMNAKSLPKARVAARRFADRWEAEHEKAVRCLRDDLDELLTGWCYPTLEPRQRFSTTHAIERRFREVRRRTSPMGVFRDRTATDRTRCAAFTLDNANQGVPTLSSLPHTC